ncbi:MAG TPA: hypothetical protein VMY37_01145 [Thermoguttaceae bacterium]|nr:hypothetical protein [Thermoguttaceae bacterium]
MQDAPVRRSGGAANGRSIAGLRALIRTPVESAPAPGYNHQQNDAKLRLAFEATADDQDEAGG